MKKYTRGIAILTASVITAGAVAILPGSGVTAQAAARVASTAAYPTQWTTQYSTVTLLKSALANPQTNANGVYEQLMLALKYCTITESEIVQLVNEGISIPASVIQRLSSEGWISSYLAKVLTGQAPTAADYSAVFDAAYYVTANPAIAAAVQNGTLPNDPDTLLQNYLLCGLPAGLNGNAAFDIAAYEAENPDVVTACGGNRVAEVAYYMLNQ